MTGSVSVQDVVADVIPVADETTLTDLRRQVIRAQLDNEPHLYAFLQTHLDLDSMDDFETEVVTEYSQATAEALDERSLLLCVALHRVNDVRWLNRYFISLHRSLRNGGYIVGRGETLAAHRRRFFRKHRGPFARILYFAHFLYVRIMPKLWLTKKLYFWISRGKNRAFSKAEILGRLCYCGFKIVAVQERDDDFFFIAKKVKEPSAEPKPSYSPIISLRRVGHNGKIIRIKKFRTMHPYSEYLQEYVYEQNHLQSNGKFKDDFRITGWGKFMRKYWLDELPQLINYFCGNINLMGVRALSEHYLSLYPADLKELRKRFKPGLIPPYYADLPGSFDEIIESERRYFAARMQHGFLTDDRYLCKAVANILLKKARSV